MKKIITVIALFSLIGMAKAQNVNIPDVNFKNTLIALGVDANSDADIQVSEALVPTTLNVGSSNIADLTGIEAFLNLQYLNCGANQLNSLTAISTLTSLQSVDCSSNQLTSLDVSGLTNLASLYCSGNQLSSLILGNLTNLQNLHCFNNQLTTIGLSGLTNLQNLVCNDNLLTSLNVGSLSNLLVLDCSDNLLTTINLSALVNLQVLTCNNNAFTSLNVSTLTNLETFSCSNNQLTFLDLSSLTNLHVLNYDNNQNSNLDISNLTNLEMLSCQNNQITNLDLSVQTNLQTLNCANNQLTSLNVSTLTGLEILDCRINQITSIDVSALTNLQVFACNLNQLTSLDLSTSTNLQFLNCSNNQLSSLYIKNGSNEVADFAMNPTLIFICADQSQISTVQSDVTLFGYINCLVNTYCSFTPGGDYNTITGTAIFDQNNNGCDVADQSIEFLSVEIDDGALAEAMFTNVAGVYYFYTDSGSFDITPTLENPSYFNISPATANISFLDDNNNTAVQDFCLTTNGTVNDLEVVLAPTTPARPGFDAEYELVFKNKGNQTLSGNVQFTYDDAVLDLLTTSITPDAQTMGSLTWNFTNLVPFETRTIVITLNVNSPQETPPVNIDDTLLFHTTINPITGDSLPLDNIFSLHQIVVGSYDPNEVECLEGEEVTPNYIGEYLHYIIRFENTGNYPAEFVVVKTEIDSAEFDIETLQILNTSHDVYTRISGNEVEFVFENIDLAPLVGDEGGHGHIILKIKSVTDLQINDMVTKMANIYFDYNLPIITNDANTVFKSLVAGISQLEFDNTISVFPNPTNGIITISAKSALKSVELYDAQGRILQTSILQSAQTTVNLSDKPAGVYFVKVTSENGSKLEQIVKD